MDNHEFIFSIIIAIYNTEKYLEEAIESIINQNFDFNKVQLILIDDGSTDKSLEICNNFKTKFPNNIVVISQENQGQASARNNGLKEVKGKYVNFLDSDDKLELNALQEVYDFFSSHDEEIDVVVIPRYYFGAVNRPMHSDNKFDQNRVVDIYKEFNFPQVSISAAFTRSSALPENFNTKLIISEDSLLINKTILNKAKFGVVGTTKYLYRKRFEENSTIDTKKFNEDYYIPRMENYFKELIDYSKKKYGNVLRYIQSVIMYDFQWLFIEDTANGVLNKAQLHEYCGYIRDILQEIDDDIIRSQQYLNKFYEYHILNIKYDSPNFKTIVNEDDVLLNYNDVLFDKFTSHNILITDMSIKYDLVKIIGIFESCIENFSVTGFKNDSPLKIQRIYGDEDYAMGNKVSNKFYFEVIAELDTGKNEFSFNVHFNDTDFPIDIYSKLRNINYNKNNIYIDFEKDYSNVDSIISDYEIMNTKLDYNQYKIYELENKIKKLQDDIRMDKQEKQELVNNLKRYKDRYFDLKNSL